jgi:hypothetical protein
MNSRLPLENADTVSLVCALLVRFPELASIRSMPAEGSVRLTFALRARLDKRAQAGLAETTFIHVTRDTDSFSKEELELIVALLRERYPEVLVRNPQPEDHLDADPAAQDEAALYAIEALRDPAQSKSLVGFREEARVLVYFLKAQRKAKASSRR